MILEHAVLQVDPSQSARFEAAFDVARTIISEVPGFIRLRLSHCLESPERYLLLVEWSHTIGFRQSPGYKKWRELLHHFYEPFPTVEHYSTVLEV
ncbi:antibiotic biosynthesis monooxygenase family protein [Rhodococcus erythropolis]